MNKISNPMPYDFMVKHTPQQAWIKGKGVFLWLAFFFSEIGAGIYFVSLFLNLPPGWLFGWLLTLVVGGGVHIAYLGKPQRGILMLLKPAKSELSRGLWVMVCFALAGFFQVAPVLFPGLPWTGTDTILKVIMGILCILLMTHGFLTMSVIRAIPLWNTSMMIPLSVVSGIWVGSQIVVIISVLATKDVNLAEIWARWSLFGLMVSLGIFMQGALQSTTAARASIMSILAGEWSTPFYVGVVGIGMVIPLIITLAIWGTDMGSVNLGILLVRGVCVVTSDLMLRYAIMKNAYYSPLI